MSNFAKYLQLVKEEKGYVDLQGTSGLYLVKVLPPNSTEDQAHFISIAQTATIAQLSAQLRALSKNKKFGKELTVSLGLGETNYNNSTKLSEIFQDNLIEFEVQEVPGKTAYQVVLVTKPK